MLKRIYINKERQDALRKSGAITFNSLPESLKKIYRVRCGVCGVSLKYNNVGRHMRKIHDDLTNDKVLWPVISENDNLCVICGEGGGIKLTSRLESLRGLSKGKISKGKHAHEKCVKWMNSKLTKTKTTISSVE